MWQDQGLFFTLLLNAAALVVLSVIAALLHYLSRCARLLRPNRPGSATATFFTQPPTVLLRRSERDVAEKLGVHAALYLTFIKAAFRLFALGTVPAVLVGLLCLTDGYLDAYTKRFDPFKCDGRMNPADCTQSPFCRWVASNATHAVCEIQWTDGLFDLSAQNLTPGGWRVVVFGFASTLFALALAIVVRELVAQVSEHVTASFLRPLNPETRYAGLGSVGARTVLLTGLGGVRDGLQGTAPEFINRHAAKGAVPELLQSSEALLHFLRSGPKRSSGSDEDMSPDRHLLAFFPPDLSVAEAAEAADDDGVVIVKAPPPGLLGLSAEYTDALAALRDDAAADGALPPSERPLRKRVGLCCTAVDAVDYEADRVVALAARLVPLLGQREAQRPVGVAFVRFSTPAAALAFQRAFNRRRLTTASASIAGVARGFLWSNIAVPAPVAHVRWLLVLAAFTVLVFFWGVPVGFLGSINSLATLPVVGQPFRGFVRDLSPLSRGLLNAYLPTVVIMTFNLLLPYMLRLFARVSGVRTVQSETATTLRLYYAFTLLSGLVLQACLQGGLSQLAGMVVHPQFETFRAMLVAIVSPQGGYWFAYLVAAGCMSMFLELLQLGALTKAAFFAPWTKRQESYDALFAAREWDVAVFGARALFFLSVGLLFHTTVPALVPFAALYFGNAYLVQRSVMLDSSRPQSAPSLDFSVIHTMVRVLLSLHSVASVATAVVCFSKTSWLGGLFAATTVAINVGLHAYTHMRLAPVLSPTPDAVALMERDVDPAARQDPLEESFLPAFATFAVDGDAPSAARSQQYTLVTTWPLRARSQPAV